MSNLNSVAGIAQVGSGRDQFSAQTVAATTETILQVNTDSGTPVNFYALAPSGGQIRGARTSLDYNGNPAITQRGGYMSGLPNGETNDVFNSGSWDGHLMKVRVVGIGNAGANAGQSVIINLYQGTSATVGSNVKVGTTGAAFVTVAGGPFSFFVEGTYMWDSVSGILSGFYQANIAFGTASQIVAPTKVAASVTSVTTAGLAFNATLVLGNAASSTVTLKEFVVDRV